MVALGGNALLRPGEPLEAANEEKAAHDAAVRLADVARDHRLVVTHGNGPQVGLLALLGESYDGSSRTRSTSSTPRPPDRPR